VRLRCGAVLGTAASLSVLGTRTMDDSVGSVVISVMELMGVYM